MKIGTRSVCFGAHQFLLHPLFVALAWWKLYGFPFDPRIWLAFFVHDLGYIGKPNLDGPEGESHVELGAAIMGVFGSKWADFCRYHSRFYARRDNAAFSRLCVADKYAFCLTPKGLYLPMVRWTGELDEYMNDREKYIGEPLTPLEAENLAANTPQSWHAFVRSYLGRWVAEHQNGTRDTWTPQPLLR